MLRALPSPKGTPKRYYIFKGAQDATAEIKDDLAMKLLEFLRSKLSPEDHAALAKMLGADPGEAMDSPEPFTGMPRTGAEDSALGVISRARANAGRIKVNI